MTEGLMRMTGKRHAHYRKLLTGRLRRASVDAMGADMVRLSLQEVAGWPVDETIELWSCVQRLLRNVTLGLLFGGCDQESRWIADAVSALTTRKWARATLAFPFNLPFTSYHRVVRDAEILERRILAWADLKRGNEDERDLAALIVNSPDVEGYPASSATIIGQIPSLYGGATEAGQSTLFWTLILLAQHPHIARELLDEILGRLGGATPSIQAIIELPFLDAIVKESMRVIPPVPLATRVAQDDTTLAGERLPKRTRVLLGAFLTTRMPDLFHQPDLFLPRRWWTINPTPFEFPVFGAGPRICPGYWFGLNAIKVALVTILMRYRVALQPNVRIDYTILPTLRPTGPVPVTLHRQDGDFAAAPIRGNIQQLIRL
jgi:cytochrome P450